MFKYYTFKKPIRLSMAHISTALLLLMPVQFLQAESITVPMKADFPLLRQFVVTQLFTGESVSTELLQDPSGCSEIVLSDPQLSEFEQQLQIKSRLKARLAVNIMDQCVPLFSWDGYAQIISNPVIKADNPRQIFLQVIDSHLISLNNERLTSGKLWEQARIHFHHLLDRFSLDLTPTINELKTFLPLFLPKQSHQQLNGMLNSLRLADLHTTAAGIQLNLSFNVAEIAVTNQSEHPLTEQELQRWQQKWQGMDALLTHTIKYYAAATELEELRLMLLDMLIDARFQLQTALQQDQKQDPVKHWFINSWSQLMPVLQQISTHQPKHATLGLMTMITATEAIQAMDKIGPNLGLEISIDGLRRLARMVNRLPHSDPLKYEDNLDPELIRLFNLNVGINQDSRSILDFWPIKSVQAASRPLNLWIPEKKEIKDYLLAVRKMLRHKAKLVTAKSKLTTQQQDLFSKMLMAAAWQESCWRQYVIKQNKIVPLRSSTGDTGIMQVNERVWRGFVDIHKLRWDIEYNIQSGSNILLDYMTRHAIKKGEHKQRGGLDNLARASYSAYNGGPSQVSRYRKSNVAAALHKIDNAFLKKYLAVKQGKELTVAECLGLSKEAIKTNRVKNKNNTQIHPLATRAKSAQVHNEAWINQQSKNHFTLQLGVFSTRQAAKNFIKKQLVTGNFAIYQQQKNRQMNYAVIYGRYSSRQRAKNETSLFVKIKPWIRSFKDIQS